MNTYYGRKRSVFMRKIFDVCKAFGSMLASGIRRFYTCTGFTLIFFALSAYTIFNDDMNQKLSDVFLRLMMVCVLGFFLSANFTLIAERLAQNSKRIKILNTAISFIISALYFFFVLKDIQNQYQVATYIGIIIALGAIALYFSNKKKDDFPIHFSYIIKSLFLSAFISFIVMLGLFLCMAAIQYLLYDFNKAYRLYAIIASFCWSLFFVNLFMAQIPKEAEDYQLPKFFKVVTLYTALPIYIGLILILYGYLGKIIITRQFPSGQLNWFASFASLIGIFLFLAIKQYAQSNKMAKWYTKLFGYVLLPIIVMQCIAYGIRFSNYGFTSARYLSAVLIGISIVTAVLSFIREGKYISYILFLIAICSLLTTTGYLNLIDVPIYEQNARLTRILQAQNMLNHGNEIIPKSDLAQEVKNKIESAYQYIKKEDIKKSALLKNTEGQTFQQIFGFEATSNFRNQSTYVHYESKEQQLNIQGYRTLIDISNHYKRPIAEAIQENRLTVASADKTYTYDLNDFINALYKEYGDQSEIPQEKLMVVQEDDKLIIKNISFEINMATNRIKLNYLEGYILQK